MALPVAVWSASLARQMIFELRTDGVLSWQLDSCTGALMPILAVGLSFVLVILAAGYAALGTLEHPRRSPEQLSLRTIFSRNQILVMAVIAVLGGWFGLTHWVDWRINQPCL